MGNDASLGRRVIGPRFVFDRPISVLECFSCPKVNLYLPSRRLPLINLLQRLVYNYIHSLEEPAQTFVPIQQRNKYKELNQKKKKKQLCDDDDERSNFNYLFTVICV